MEFARKSGAAARQKSLFDWEDVRKIQLGRSLSYFDDLKCSRMKVLLNVFSQNISKKSLDGLFPNIFTMVEEIFDFADLKCSRKSFTMVEKNFGFWLSKMLQNEGFERFISEHLHHDWRKFWVLMMADTLKWRTWFRRLVPDPPSILDRPRTQINLG